MNDEFISIALLDEAQKIYGLTDEEIENSFDRILLAVEFFQNNWKSVTDTEHSRIHTIIESLDKALSFMISDDWLDYELEDPPFVDQESAFLWLQNFYYETDNWFSRETNWAIRSIWIIRLDLVRQLEDLQSIYEVRMEDQDAVFGTNMEFNSSRISMPYQIYIRSLCSVWYDLTGEIGLPSRDPEPDNPLLRFIDKLLEHSSKSIWPSKKSVLNFVAKYVRPSLRKEKEANKEFEMEMEKSLAKLGSLKDIEFDPF